MTRAEYLNSAGDRNEAHRAYYAQFVTPAIIGRVRRYIGADRIAQSPDRDGAFNDIPLQRWDMIPIPGETVTAMKGHGDYLTPVGWVCIVKEAARQIREGVRL